MGLILNRTLPIGTLRRVRHPLIASALDTLFESRYASGGSVKKNCCVKTAAYLEKLSPQKAAKYLLLGANYLKTSNFTIKDHLAGVIDVFNDAFFALEVAKELISLAPEAKALLLLSEKYKTRIQACGNEAMAKESLAAARSVATIRRLPVTTEDIHEAAKQSYNNPNDIVAALDEIFQFCARQTESGGKHFDQKTLNANLIVFKGNNRGFLGIINSYVNVRISL
ncbi:hypothetical protein A3J44_05450 [candidate division WOR-1 bacterium RIFCSPHIGHO2_02_FULL_45_12]|uniref:Uncharacterized protein n=1 Tax=candidate division WOR-1 bacterium RIFCSPLOWO2_12_FULL_45_9 TaxID=1802568 RepID=A0A1F4RME5_UNCSA|nr:MAG: hypothetical protein A3J44_05450 [candidate division WOR-1 bacterium RIFCSPHIGHO2_02_FULL_45_12]OGC09328.1 MAG: hypothetical protein A3F86_00555 [candidate division WOR-1 bacterium RIFCSPLOWO2_12_FULL_45_9]